MERRKPYYQVVYSTNTGWDDCKCFGTLREAKAFANKHINCAINRWLNEYEEDLSFKPILINMED